eukprot:2599480-Rhodomonas_salina.1
MAFPSPSSEQYPLTPTQDDHAQLHHLLDTTSLENRLSPSPLMTPNSPSQSMDTSQENECPEEREAGESSSAAVLTGSQSPTGRKNRKRLPDNECTAAALRMRAMRERRQQEISAGQSNVKESLKFFTIN